MAGLLARRHRPASLRAAIRAMPADGAYAAQLADEFYASEPALARSLLLQAVALNPYDAASWIQLGLLYEAGNSMDAAEDALLRAAGADATFLPAWSLANFYFRRQDSPQFWRWAQRAAYMAPGDATPLLRLAWYMSPRVGVIEERLLRQRPVVQAQFVNFLIARGEPQAVSEAAAHLLETGNDGAAAAVLGACDWLVATQHPELALPLWNGLAGNHQIAYSALTPATADRITNGNFARQPTSLGFDWHLAAVNGASSFLNSSPNALGFEFSGEEPDSFVLLSQVAPVEPEKTYALVVVADSRGIAPGNGMAWRVTGKGALLAQAPVPSGPYGGQTIACFTTGKDSHFVDLSLGYERAPGTVRPEGKLALTQVGLSVAAGQQCALGAPRSN